MNRPTGTRGTDGWTQLLPALGMIAGGAVALLVLVVLQGDGAVMGTTMAGGAGAGLLLGCIAWMAVRRR